MLSIFLFKVSKSVTKGGEKGKRKEEEGREQDVNGRKQSLRDNIRLFLL
jgi:hypothetical protein